MLRHCSSPGSSGCRQPPSLPQYALEMSSLCRWTRRGLGNISVMQFWSEILPTDHQHLKHDAVVIFALSFFWVFKPLFFFKLKIFQVSKKSVVYLHHVKSSQKESKTAGWEPPIASAGKVSLEPKWSWTKFVPLLGHWARDGRREERKKEHSFQPTSQGANKMLGEGEFLTPWV